ncbi:MAG TPA: UDP-N-acetylglucosamine--N-acetylmuramyl-(pentapeptide) pyrophosphoryl-undecaprenol N-acetylglucosamine transferase [Gaiellaceae bacterium]|nr:UDP-N-acetylglucosamine--N-acetylmuramyl-(pentapeptide) pyrophosphoryl-undecaprenol N-acetylglucosamine transferase [Gaiellaceae bacterium]
MEQQRPNVRCLIAAGGTAGHVAPSLAVAEALQRRGAHVTFAGSPDRIEARLVPEAGYELDTFRISGLPRRPSPELARALLLAGRAPWACARILAARRPNVVLGGGGYVAGPMVYAAARRKIPTALMEADAHLGLANRLAAPFAARVFLSFPIAGRDGSKYRVTGRPIPARSRAVPREEARSLFGLPREGPVLLVFGGSLGAHVLNELAIEAFGEAGPAVLHLSGTRDYDGLRTRVTRPDYRLFAFAEEFGAALGASDLALARAGGSLWELAAAGKPAVLVPGLFATGDHQTKNAQYFEQGGGAVVVPEEDVSQAPDLIRSLLDDPSRLAEMSAAMTRLARPDAAEEIAEELIALAS